MGNMLVPGVMTFPWLAGNELVLGDGHMLNPIRGTITEPDTTPECNDESTFDPQLGWEGQRKERGMYLGMYLKYTFSSVHGSSSAAAETLRFGTQGSRKCQTPIYFSR